MENRFTKILDKFNKDYKIDEEDNLYLQIQSEECDYWEHKRITYMQLVMVEFIDEELGIVKYTEFNSGNESNKVSTYVTMDELCSTFLKYIDDIESKEDK